MPKKTHQIILEYRNQVKELDDETTKLYEKLKEELKETEEGKKIISEKEDFLWDYIYNGTEYCLKNL